MRRVEVVVSAGKPQNQVGTDFGPTPWFTGVLGVLPNIVLVSSLGALVTKEDQTFRTKPTLRYTSRVPYVIKGNIITIYFTFRSSCTQTGLGSPTSHGIHLAQGLRTHSNHKFDIISTFNLFHNPRAAAWPTTCRTPVELLGILMWCR